MCVHTSVWLYAYTYKCVIVRIHTSVWLCACTYISMVVCVLVVCHHVYIRMYVYMCVHVD